MFATLFRVNVSDRWIIWGEYATMIDAIRSLADIHLDQGDNVRTRIIRIG